MIYVMKKMINLKWSVSLSFPKHGTLGNILLLLLSLCTFGPTMLWGQKYVDVHISCFCKKLWNFTMRICSLHKNMFSACFVKIPILSRIFSKKHGAALICKRSYQGSEVQMIKSESGSKKEKKILKVSSKNWRKKRKWYKQIWYFFSMIRIQSDLIKNRCSLKMADMTKKVFKKL